jgi:hypothetical protein
MVFPQKEHVMKSWITNAMVIALVGATAASSSCSSGPSGSADETNGGSVETDLKIGRTTQIRSVGYTVAGPNGFTRTGSLDVSHHREAEGTVSDVPAGGPYTITLTASSTDGNVTCTGSKSGIVVTCPGTREQDENNIRLICSRNHLGREWGDMDWRSNAKTFVLGVEIKLACLNDAGAPEACAPATACPAGQVCGQASDGCGGMIACGTCPAGQACDVKNHCVCIPQATCPVGQTCGTAPDGCGGTMICGTCSSGTVCGPDNACHDAPCDISSTTTACLQVRGSTGTCLQCAQSNGCLDPAAGGGACEDIPGTQTHLMGPLPDGRMCTVATSAGPAVFESPTETETQICMQTLDEIFSSKCSRDGTLTGCLCGTTPASPCLSGAITPTGPLFDLYACDFNTINQVQNKFLLPSGSSQANGIVQCLGAFGCDCFQDKVCNPLTACPAGRVCGSIPNGCGGTVTCGTCPAGQSCTIQGTCCQPATTCPAGVTCGTAPDGCGGTINCGTCPSGQSCTSQGTCCQPTGTCPPGAVCGTVPDGCGGTINCGTCVGETVCAPDHTCHSIIGACGLQGNTRDCLLAQDKPGQSSCLQCVLANGCLDPALSGGACEDVPGTLPHFAGTLPDGRSCTASSDAGSAVLSPSETETQICLQALGNIFSSQCAATLQLTPCFCGATDAAQCVSCAVTPVGPLFDLYACDINTTSCSVVQTDFTVPTFGVGMANAIAECAGAFNCNCF